MDKENAPEEDSAIEAFDLSDEQVSSLKSAHGELIAGHAKGVGTFVFKSPSQLSYETMINGVMGEAKAEAMRLYVRSCLAWPVDDGGKPDRARFDAVVRMSPGLVGEVFPAVRELGAGEVTVKKL